MRTRLFAALDLPEDMKQHLTAVLAEFREALPPRAVRWVRPEGMHLTVKFFGNVRAEQAEALPAALRQAAAQAAPVPAVVEGLGVFPDTRRPQVIWVGLTGNLEALQALVEAVEQAAETLGFRRERRAYHPHLTLGRVNGGLRPAEQLQLLRFLSETHLRRLGEFTARELVLLRSELRPGGSVYTPVFAAPLGQAHSVTGG